MLVNPSNNFTNNVIWVVRNDWYKITKIQKKQGIDGQNLVLRPKIGDTKKEEPKIS